MQKDLILVIEDESDIAELIRFNLQREGYDVQTLFSGVDVLRTVHNTPPNCILLDLMLPGIDGLTICRLLKKDTSTANIPIIMVTAKGEEVDIVTGLELGADDYITKPFKIRELIARVKSVLRRNATVPVMEGDVIRIGDLAIFPEKFEVVVQNHSVKLTQTEFKILHSMMKKPGRVFTRYQIVDIARGSESMVTDRSVDVHIVALRRKLGIVGKMIETVHGVGYKFRE